MTINPTSLTVTEGDAAGASYTVVLTSQPAGNVTIAISGHAGTDLTLSGTTLTNNVLTFTDQNWSTAQTVKVVAGEDDDATTDPDVTLVHDIRQHRRHGLRRPGGPERDRLHHRERRRGGDHRLPQI